MTDLEVLLGAALAAVAVINALALYRQRSSSTQSVRETALSARPGDERAAIGSLPSKQQVLAERERIKLELERERGTKVITLIHRRESWTPAGEEPEIVLEDSEAVLAEIRRTPPDKPIDFVVHGPGGLSLAAQQMAMAVKSHNAKTTAFIPFYAMSGGSLVALAANEIRMDKNSIIGPVDPQIGEHSASAYISILKRKSLDSIRDETFMLAERAELETRNTKEFVKWLLRDKMNERQAARVAEFLTGGYMSHDTMITLDPARKIGLNVVEGIPDRVYEMFRSFEFSIPRKTGTHE